MINLKITGIRLKLNRDDRSYIQRKIGRLDHLIPEKARDSAKGRVVLKSGAGRPPSVICEVTIDLPKRAIFAQQTATTINEAVDLVEDKLARQIRKYKTIGGDRRGLIGRFWQRFRPGA